MALRAGQRRLRLRDRRNWRARDQLLDRERGAQLDELCFGADLGVLGGARLWLGDGVRLLPLAGANEPRLNLAEWAQNGTPKMSGRR